MSHFAFSWGSFGCLSEAWQGSTWAGSRPPALAPLEAPLCALLGAKPPLFSLNSLLLPELGAAAFGCSGAPDLPSLLVAVLHPCLLHHKYCTGARSRSAAAGTVLGTAPAASSAQTGLRVGGQGQGRGTPGGVRMRGQHQGSLWEGDDPIAGSSRGSWCFHSSSPWFWGGSPGPWWAPSSERAAKRGCPHPSLKSNYLQE